MGLFPMNVGGGGTTGFSSLNAYYLGSNAFTFPDTKKGDLIIYCPNGSETNLPTITNTNLIVSNNITWSETSQSAENWIHAAYLVTADSPRLTRSYHGIYVVLHV